MMRSRLSGRLIRIYRAGDTRRYGRNTGWDRKSTHAYEDDDAHTAGKYAKPPFSEPRSPGFETKALYIKKLTAKYPKTDVIAFEYPDQVPPEFVVDWETMLEKTIRQPISRIIEALGWEWADVDPSRTNLSQWGF